MNKTPPSLTKISRLLGKPPLRRAAASTLVYVTVCTIYIVVSSRLAAAFAQTTQQLQTIEAFKGIAFVVVTGVLFFFLSLAWWRRSHRQTELLLQSERRAVAAMYSATLAHDVNNLLMSLLGLVEGLRGREGGDKFLLMMREELERGINNLAQLAKRLACSTMQMQLHEKKDVDMHSALSRIIELVRKHPDVRACTIGTEGISNVSLSLNESLLEQAVMNLIINAAQAAGANARIEVILKKNEGAVSLEVHDNGPGVPPEKAGAIFDPGYTTKPDGTGLGSLSVMAFASACNAHVSVDRSNIGGALFRIRIPMPGETSTGATDSVSPSAPTAATFPESAEPKLRLS